MPKQIAIGDDLYLWTYDAAGNPAPNLVISAHGGYSGEDRITRPQGTTLAFYGPHKVALQDPGLDKIMDARAKAVAVNHGGTCINYFLSKYQGKHSKGAETYQSIGDLLTKGTTWEQMNQLLAGDPKAAQMGIKPVPQTLVDQYKSYDVLTIRNRWNIGRGVKLGTVLDRLEKFAGGKYKYPMIHCSFCRVDMWALKHQSYNPVTGQTE